jgi:hypothetical protein
MRIDVYVSRSCSHREETQRLVAEAVAEANAEGIEVATVEVEGPEDARTKKVFGSPTVRVNGVDVEYGDREPEETSAGCRYYSTPDGWKPVPTRGMITRSIAVARAREQRGG